MEYKEVFICDKCENATFIFYCNGQVECAKCETIVSEPLKNMAGSQKVH